MNFKKLKRLLSIVLSATMILSSNMTGLAAEIATDPAADPAAVTEESQEPGEHEHQWAAEELRGIKRYVCTVEGCTATTYDVMPLADEGTTDGSEETDPAEPATNVITVGGTDGATWANAVNEATTTGKQISLAGDITLSGRNTRYALGDITVNTNGYTITIANGSTVTLEGGKFINTEYAEPEISDRALFWTDMDLNQTIINVDDGASLTINGGEYKTNGVKAIVVSGEATIKSGDFSVGKEEDGFVLPSNHYDGASLIEVKGQGILTMTGGKVSADIGEGQDGMYGIFVNDGGAVILGGDEPSQPEITSRFGAVGTNFTMPTGSIHITSGKYTSTIGCTGDFECYNAVLYLATLCDVTIDGGTFEATGTAGDGKTHIMSASEKADREIVINGGTFISTGTAFTGNGFDQIEGIIKGGDFSGVADKDNLDDYVADGYDITNGKVESTSPTVAEINGTKYDTLAQAIDAALAQEGAVTIELNENAELSGTKAYNLENITINTNGWMISITDNAKIRLTDATIVNSEYAKKDENNHFEDFASNRTMLDVYEGSKLTITGGEYKTKGVELIHVEGNVVIEESATFECTAEIDEIGGSLEYYDGAALFSVTQKGVLNMTGGTIKANIGSGDYGLYGIYVWEEGTVILGGKDSNGTSFEPEIDAYSPAISMNGTKSPANITIHGGTYRSHVNCGGDDEKFNAVLYLSADCTMLIDGGRFESVAADGESDTDKARRHVIAIPYVKDTKLEILGGEFISDGSVFNVGTGVNVKPVKGGTFSSDVQDFCASGYTSGAIEGLGGIYGVTLSCQHDAEKVEYHGAMASTCQEKGNVAYYECTNCGKKFGVNPVGLTGDDLKDAELENVETETLSHEGRYVAVGDGVTDDNAENITKKCNEPVCIKAHYICDNCGKIYASITDLKNFDPIQNPEEYYAIKDHDFSVYSYDWPESDDDGENTLTVNNFVEFKAMHDKIMAGVRVTRSCSECGTLEDPELTNLVSLIPGDVEGDGITLDSDDAGEIDAFILADCEDGATITYTITPTGSDFENSENGIDTADEDAGDDADDNTGDDGQDTESSTFILKLAEGADHTYSNYTLSDTTIDLAHLDSIKVIGKCANCAATSESVGTIELKKEGTNDDVTPNCTENQKLTVDVYAKFEANGTLSKACTQEVEILARGHKLVKYHPYIAPTCSTEGQRVYYECDCEATFWSQNHADANIEIDGSKESWVIPATGHNFGKPKFDWEDINDPKNTNVTATFTCGVCDATVTLRGDGLSDDDDSLVRIEEANTPSINAKDPCEEEITINYNIEADFNRTYVVTDPQNKDAFGAPLCTYDPDNDDADSAYTFTFEGTLPAKSVIPGHQFVLTSLLWNDSSDPKYVDADKGITAILTCMVCGGTVTIDNMKGVTSITSGNTGDSDPATIKSAKGNIRRVLLSSKEADCGSDGSDVYAITVNCRTGVDTEYIAYTTTGTIKEDNDGKKVVEDEKAALLVAEKVALGHNFIISSEYEDGSKGVKWEHNPVIGSNGSVQAGTVLVRLVCQNNPEHIRTLSGSDLGGTDGINLNYVSEESHAGSCTMDAVYTWEVTATHEGVVYTYFDEPGVKEGNDDEDADEDAGTGTSVAAEGDEGEGTGGEEDAANKRIKIQYVIPATGHSYDISEESFGTDEGGHWNTDLFYNEAEEKLIPDGEIYLEYVCQNEDCDHTAPVDEDGNEETGYESDGRWVKQIVATRETGEGSSAGCESEGTAIYNVTATDLAGVERTATFTFDLKQLGHDFNLDNEDNRLTWDPVTEDGKQVTITKVIDGTSYQIPAYKATLERVCKNDSSHKASSSTIMKDGEDESTTSDLDPAYIKIGITVTKAPTCEETGLATYTATLVSVDEQGNTLKETPLADPYPSKEVELAALGHEDSKTLSLDWENAGEVATDAEITINGQVVQYVDYKYYVPVKAVCKRCGKDVDLDKAGIDYNDLGIDTVEFDDGNEVAALTADREGTCKVDAVITENPGVTYTVILPKSEGDPEVTLDEAPEEESVTISGYTIKNPTYQMEGTTHKLKYVEGHTSSSCNEVSYPAHFHCTACGRNYQSPAASLLAEVSYEPQGHTYGEPEFTWLENTDGGITGIAKFTCIRHDDERLIAAEVGEELVESIPAKCDGVENPEGTGYRSIVASFNDKRYESYIPVTIPAVDHEFDDDGLCIYCKKAYAEVQFTGRNGAVDVTKYYMVKADGTYNIEFPVPPNQAGYEFVGWQVDGEDFLLSEADAEESAIAAVKEALDGSEDTHKKATVTLLYNQEATKATVTVINIVDGEEKSRRTIENVTIGEAYPLTAESIEGETFSCWAEDAEGNNVLSTSTEYRLYIPSKTTEKTVYAIYGMESVEANAITMGTPYTSEVNGTPKISFVSAINLPAGATVVESGFVYITLFDDELEGFDTEDLKVNSANANVKNKSLGGSVANVFTLSLGSNAANKTKNILIKGYVFYKLEGGTEIKEDYTELLQTTYADTKNLEDAAAGGNE